MEFQHCWNLWVIKLLDGLMGDGQNWKKWVEFLKQNNEKLFLELEDYEAMN